MMPDVFIESLHGYFSNSGIERFAEQLETYKQPLGSTPFEQVCAQIANRYFDRVIARLRDLPNQQGMLDGDVLQAICKDESAQLYGEPFFDLQHIGGGDIFIERVEEQPYYQFLSRYPELFNADGALIRREYSKKKAEIDEAFTDFLKSTAPLRKADYEIELAEQYLKYGALYDAQDTVLAQWGQKMSDLHRDAYSLTHGMLKGDRLDNFRQDIQALKQDRIPGMPGAYQHRVAKILNAYVSDVLAALNENNRLTDHRLNAVLDSMYIYTASGLLEQEPDSAIQVVKRNELQVLTSGYMKFLRGEGYAPDPENFPLDRYAGDKEQLDMAYTATPDPEQFLQGKSEIQAFETACTMAQLRRLKESISDCFIENLGSSQNKNKAGWSLN